jgi:hypothetical protein
MRWVAAVSEAHYVGIVTSGVGAGIDHGVPVRLDEGADRVERNRESNARCAPQGRGWQYA